MLYDLYPKVWCFFVQYPLQNLPRLWDWWGYMTQMPFTTSVVYLLPLVWKGRPEWGDHGQSPPNHALQAKPGVQQVSWLPVHNVWHPLLPWPAGLLPTLREWSLSVSSIWVIFGRSTTASAGNPNKKVKMEWSTQAALLGIPLPPLQPWGRTSREGIPPPTHTTHHLLFHKTWLSSHLLSVHKTNFTVVNENSKQY